MKAASRSYYPLEIIDLGQNSSISRGWTDSDDCVSSLNDTFAQKNDIGLKLIESLFVVTEGRRLRFYKLGTRPLKKEPAPADSHSEICDEWCTLFEYHSLSARNETVCLSTGGSVYLGYGKMVGFEMHLELSREYCHKKRLSLRLGRASVTLVPAGRQQGSCFVHNESGYNEALLNKECNRKAKSTYLSSFDKTGNEGGLEEIFVYDLDNDGWIAPKDALFDMLSPMFAVSEQDMMLFRFGAAGFGEIRFYDAPMCAG